MRTITILAIEHDRRGRAVSRMNLTFTEFELQRVGLTDDQMTDLLVHALEVVLIGHKHMTTFVPERSHHKGSGVGR